MRLSQMVSKSRSALLHGLLIVPALLVGISTVQAGNTEANDSVNPVGIDAKRLIEWVLENNATVADQRLGVEAAGFRAQAEQGLYEPIWSSTVSHDHNRRRRSSSEYLSFDVNAKTEDLDRTDELKTGVKVALPTGGEASVNYRFSKADSNLFPTTIEKEYSSQLELKLVQPLLRGRGQKVTETTMRVARLEERASQLQYRQDLTDVAGEAAKLYWQLYRVHEVVRIRQNALDNAIKSMSDLQDRVDRGKAAETDLLETEANIVDREAELLLARQVMSEVLTNIRISLNLAEGGLNSFRLQPLQSPNTALLEGVTLEARLAYALQHHSEYQLLDVQRQQQQELYDYAKNQELLQMDLSVGYSFDNLGQKADKTLEDTLTSKYQDWYLGVMLKIPLGGNIRARSESLAQKRSLDQALLRHQALYNRLSNDIEGRLDQLKKAHSEVERVNKSVELHEKLLAVEYERFHHGKVRFRDVLEREILLNDAHQRFVETAVRVELARIALLTAEGRLLEKYGIE